MSEQKRDDLTVIKGIGTVRQRWLADVFGVYTFADLAAVSVDEVEAVAREEGIILSRSKILSWIEQANELLALTSDLAVMEEENGAAESEAENGVPAWVADLRENNGIDPGIKAEVWKPIASFVVEFQESVHEGRPAECRTAVHHIEADVGTTWPGIEKTQLCQWMEQRASIKEIKEPVPAVIVPQQETAATLRVTKARLLQSPDYSATLNVPDVERPFMGHVNHEKPITLEVDFELSESASEGKLAPLEYKAQCHVHNLMSRKKAFFLDMKATSPTDEDPAYKSTLLEVLLEPGMYKLGILVSGKRPLRVNYFELPKLNVL
jgi:hypothetical protein